MKLLTLVISLPLAIYSCGESEKYISENGSDNLKNSAGTFEYSYLIKDVGYTRVPLENIPPDVTGILAELGRNPSNGAYISESSPDKYPKTFAVYTINNIESRYVDHYYLIIKFDDKIHLAENRKLPPRAEFVSE